MIEPRLVAVRDYVSPRQRELTVPEASVRRVAIDLKSGDDWAIRIAAPAMAASMEPVARRDRRPILVPIPTSTGDLRPNERLAKQISALVGGYVLPAVGRQRPVESSRLRRQSGEPGLTRAEQLASMTLRMDRDALLPGHPVWLVDNVITTGATILAAWDALGRPPDSYGLAWAKAEEIPTMNPPAPFPQSDDEYAAIIEHLRRHRVRFSPYAGCVVAGGRKIRTLAEATELTGGVVQNPAWLARAVVDHFDVIRAAAPARWMPEFDRMRAEGRGNKITAELAQLGCGAYGCVLETADPTVVFKVTGDSTEVEFVRQVLPKVQPEGIVRYYATVDLPATHKGSPLFALWREAADAIGQVSEGAVKLLKRAHAVSDQVFGQLHGAADPHQLYLDAMAAGARGTTPPARLARLIDGMTAAWEKMATHAELEHVGKALLSFWHAGVLVADVHDSNVGHVERAGTDLVVITDPGHTAVLPQPWR